METPAAFHVTTGGGLLIMKKERIYYFDTFRFLGIMFVFTTHYIHEFSPESAMYFFVRPYSFLLGGLTGKFGLAALLVILGYFSYLKGEKSERNLLLLYIQRYLYFVIAAAFLYAAAIAVKYIDMHEEGKNVFLVFLDQCLGLKDTYYPLFWCLIPMLLSTVVCYFLGRAKARWDMILVILLVFHFCGAVWIVLSLFGTFLVRIERYTKLDGFLKKWWVQCILVLVPFALTHQGPTESTLIYYLDGFFWFCFILATMKGTALKKIFNAKPWRLVNRCYFGIFLLHVLIYDTLGRMLLNKTLLKIPFGPRFILVYVIVVTVTILLSFPTDFCINSVSRWLTRLTNSLDDRIKACLAGRGKADGN